VAIVDDHPVVRQGLVALIEGEPDLEVCGEAEDVEGGLALVARTVPQIVLVDISLKGGDGLELIRRLRASGNAARVLVLSVHDERLYAERAIAAGANGYIMKAEATDRLREALRSVLQGELYVSTGKRASGQRPALDLPTALRTLSDRELEIFGLFGQGMATREIARRLGLSLKTVEAHRSNIRRKLALKRGTELVHLAIRWVAAGGGSLAPPPADDPSEGN